MALDFIRKSRRELRGMDAPFADLRHTGRKESIRPCWSMRQDCARRFWGMMSGRAGLSGPCTRCFARRLRETSMLECETWHDGPWRPYRRHGLCLLTVSHLQEFDCPFSTSFGKHPPLAIVVVACIVNKAATMQGSYWRARPRNGATGRGHVLQLCRHQLAQPELRPAHCCSW